MIDLLPPRPESFPRYAEVVAQCRYNATGSTGTPGTRRAKPMKVDHQEVIELYLILEAERHPAPRKEIAIILNCHAGSVSRILREAGY